MKGNNFQGVIMQGVGLLFIGISTIFFSVLIGFFKTLTILILDPSTLG